MRCPSWLVPLLVLLAPPLASAQVVVVPPRPAPPGYIQGRIHWHVRRSLPPAVYVSPVPPPVWVAPAAPPPPVYVAPPPVVIAPQPQFYVQPQPVYVRPAPPAPAAPPPPPLPEWRSRFGLGATFEGVWTKGETTGQGYGILGQLRYRSSRHTALELMAGYEQSALADGLKRSDVPVSFGLLVPFLGPEHLFSPYVVFAAGVNFADLRLVDTPALKLDDNRIQVLGQLGGGIELRLGQHVALNLDARLEGRWNFAGASAQVAATTVKVDGNVVSPIQDALALRLGAGATVYF
jgi:hypothetical protein